MLDKHKKMKDKMDILGASAIAKVSPKGVDMISRIDENTSEEDMINDVVKKFDELGIDVNVIGNIEMHVEGENGTIKQIDPDLIKKAIEKSKSTSIDYEKMFEDGDDIDLVASRDNISSGSTLTIAERMLQEKYGLI